MLLPESLGLSLRQRARLAGEIVAVYVPLRRLMRENDLRAMTAAARRTGHPISIPIPPETAHATARRLGSIVRRVLFSLPTENRCLIQSLVLTRMLARRSVESRLVIGVRTGERFAAHAWVEVDGRPVLPRRRHERLYEL